MTGTRRTTEFRIARESIVDFVGSCGEGRVGPFISPVQALGSNRATPGTRLLFKLTPIPLLASFVARQALPDVRAQIHNAHPGNLPFFSHVCIRPDCFQVREVPLILQKGTNLGVTYTQLCRFVPLRSRPGAVPQGTQGLNVYEPAPKTSRPAVPNLSSYS